MRRFSRSSSLRKNQNQNQQTQSPTSYSNPQNFGSGPNTPTAAGNFPRDHQALGGDYTVVPGPSAVNNNNNNNTTINNNEGRPISSATDGSFDFPNRPVSYTNSTTGVFGSAPASAVAGTGGGSRGTGTSSQRSGVGGTTMSSQIPQSKISSGSMMLPGNLSRTDQIVLKHFWDTKYQDNAKRDLHYLKFPSFPSNPAHRDLLPYCEIYHLVKTSPGATIISLGSANGVYIGFELQTGSQLHIDLDDDWFSTNPSASITHHRVHFRPLNSLLSDPSSNSTFKSWPKPLTIEFLEDQYQAWCRDLMSPCWESQGVRELGGGGGTAAGAGGAGDYHLQQQQQQQGGGSVAGGGDGSVGGIRGDDGYDSEGSVGDGREHGHGHGHGNGRVI